MKTIVITAIILSVIIGFIAQPNYEKTRTKVVFVQSDSAEKPGRNSPSPTPKPRTKTAMVLPSQEEVARKVKGVFTRDPETAVAVFRAESGLRPDAQGWNCYYNGISSACRPEDRSKAWSTDCGVAQINTPGTICPRELLEVDTNLKRAKQKYTARGWQPWSAWLSGKHLAFLK